MSSNHTTREVVRFFARVLLIAAIGVGANGCTQEPARAVEAKPQDPIAVQVARIARRDVQRGIDVTGTLFADDQAAIAAQTPGRVVAVFKDIGDHAKPGELLAQVERTEYELLFQQREAAVNEALSRLGLDEMPGDDFDLATLPAVRRAKAQERNAFAKFNRGRELYESEPPLISAQDYADLETSFEVAQHNVTAEELAGRTLLAQARLRTADLMIVKRQLEETDILTPTRAVADEGESADDGYLIADRRVAVGESLAHGQVVFVLVDVDPIKFRAEVPERFAGDINVGQVVQVRLDAFASAFEGKITRLSPRVDPQSRTFEFEAEIDNQDQRLRPGSFAIGHVQTELHPDVMFVPSEAVVTFAGVKRIFSVVDGMAVEHRVQTGVTIDSDVEIISTDVPPDAMIVARDAHRLVDGSPVTMTMESANEDRAAVEAASALSADSR